MNELLPILITLIIGYFGLIILKNYIESKTKKEVKNRNFYEEQKTRVKIGGYKMQPLLNKTEEISRQAINKAIEGTNKRLYAQVCIGEIVKHENKQLYKDISSKRTDFLITDNKNIPIIAIEIHGQGHYQSKETTKRDEIKRIALENAGIQYLAIAVGNNTKETYIEVYKKVKEKI